MTEWDDLSAWCNARERNYRKACGDPACFPMNPGDVVDELVGRIDAALPGDCVETFVDWVIQTSARHGLAFLHAATLVSIRHRLWSKAGRLTDTSSRRAPRDLLSQHLAERVERKSRQAPLPADIWLKDRFCARPFERIEFEPDQKIRFCPAAWQPAAIGDLTEPPDEVWNSPAAEAVRRSILDGSFRYCSRRHCPEIKGRRLPARSQILAPEKLAPEKSTPERPGPSGDRHRRIVAHDVTRLEEAPAVANLSQDLSCDLSCPSCRTKVLKLREYNTRRLDSLVNADYVAFLSEVANVTISPKGEPFASEHFLRLLSEYCRKAVRKKALHLQTNGLLLTEELWNRLDLWGHVHSVRISVDAASPRVYETLKRGGRFDRLIPNLMFLGQLRRLDALEDFRLTFLVQSANLEEMPGFVRLARHVGADGAVFQRLCDWGTYGAAGFSERDVVSASHPQHFEFRKMVEDPVLRGPDIDLEAILP